MKPIKSKLPSRLYFIHSKLGEYIGPYIVKPTKIILEDDWRVSGGSIIEFVLDQNNNYIIVNK